MELTIDHLLHSDQVELLCTAVAIAEAAAKRSKTLQAKAFVRDLRRQIVRA